MGNKGAFITLTGGKLEPQYTTYEGFLLFSHLKIFKIKTLGKVSKRIVKKC